MVSKDISYSSFSTAGADYIDSINADTFDAIALGLYRYQYAHNPFYQRFSDSLRRSPATVSKVAEIPFLPVSFFKTQRIRTGDLTGTALIFETSTTTGDTPGVHEVASEELYNAALMCGFRQFYGEPEQYAILALLPSYLERKTSSLVHMARVLMTAGAHPDSGFYLHERDTLAAVLQKLERVQQRTILLGVTFALLDFAESHSLTLRQTIVMETGGMKGRREEWTRAQVHDLLQSRWGLEGVHAEYGMTEMLSQAYSSGGGIFRPSSTMKILLRELTDPLTLSDTGTGCINIIDLANVHSCAFLGTDDIGRLRSDGSFEVLGRADFSALRGCALMTA